MAIKKISANLLGNNAVTADKIADGAISAADIADNSITAAKISTSTFAIDSLTVNTSDLVVDTANNRVGIGTDSPDYKLEVESSSDADLIQIQSTASANNTFLRLGISGDIATLNASGGSSGALVIKTYGLERMRIDSSGTMILRADGAANLGRIQFSSQASTYQILGGNNIGYMGYKTGGYHRFFGSDGVEDMRIDSSGNVGINNTSPASFYSGADNLVIGNTSENNNGLTIATSNIGVGRIFFADPDSTIVGQIEYQHTANDMVFVTAAEERMRIEGSGKVGIGNTSPLGKLTISNAAGANAPETITAANTYLQLGSDDYGATGNGKFMIGFGYTDATNTNSPAYIGFEEETSSGDTAGQLTFYTRGVITDTAPTQRMRITAAGATQILHGGTTYYTSFEQNNEINTYTAAGANSTMYLNHNGGDINVRNGSLVVKDNGDITIGNTTISPASGFSDQRGFGYDNSTGFTEIAATSAGAPLEIGTNNASGSAILSLRKQGTVVGGISTFDGEVHFGRNTAGIMPIGSGTAPRVVPTSFSSGTLADGTVTLGNGDARWKDFYMAGDMNVGSQTSNIVPSNRKAWFQGGGSYFTSYSAGQSTITSDASGLIVGPPSTRSGNANHYTAGISFDHLLNYSTTGNVTYNTYPHAWIGLKTYDYPGYERSSLVLGTRNDVSGSGPTAEQLVISPYGEITMPNQPSARFYCSSGASVTSETVINSANTGATEHFDRNGDYNASTGEFSCPVAGVYLAYAYSNFTGATNPGYFLLQYYNGSSWVNYAISYKSDTGSWNSVTLFSTIEASAGVNLRFVYNGDPDAGFHWFYGGWHLLG